MVETSLTPYRRDRYHQISKYMTYFHVHARLLHSLKEHIKRSYFSYPHNNKTRNLGYNNERIDNDGAVS